MDANNKITEQEADSLARHLKDPQFFKLFEEYAREISDPKAKAENDAYLAQLEAQGQLESIYGQGVQVIQPEPGIVIKTKTRDGGTRVYINVCTCCKVDKLAFEGAKGGSKGMKLSLPNIIGNTNDKMGKTAADVQFRAFDFTINPDSLTRCLESAALLDAMATMAIEKVEEATGTKLLRKYKLPAMQYKAVDGEQRPAAMLLRTSAHGEVVDGRLRPRGGPGSLAQAAAEAGSGLQTAPQTASPTDTTAQRNTSTPSSQKRSNFSFKPRTSTPSAMQTVSDSSLAAGSSEGCCVPQYQVVERARVDLGRAWSDTGRGLQATSNDPEAVVVRVELPGVASAANIELDVTADSISLSVPAKYKLHLPLRYKIDEQLSSAKFDIRKSLMVLTLPVIQTAAGQPAQPLGQHQHSDQAAKSAEQPLVQCDQNTLTQQTTAAAAGQVPSVLSVADSPSGQPGVVQSCSLSTSDTQEGPCAVDHDENAPQVSASASKAAAAAAAPAGVQCQVPEHPLIAALPSKSCTQPAGKTDNQLKWEQLHSTEATSQSNSVVVGPPSNPLPTAIRQHQDPVQAGLPCGRLRPRLSGSRVSAADFV